MGTSNKVSKVQDAKLVMNRASVKIVQTSKYLGLMTGSRFNFVEHVNYICKKVYPKQKI